LLTLLNLSLPQVHALYHFNVTTGVAASWVRNPSFFRVQQPPAPGAPANAPPQFTTAKQNGDLSAAPIILFTGYIWPLDAESSWHVKDLRPGLSFGFSLTSPANSFYLGGSFEVRRNVQLIAGYNFAKINALAPSGFDPGTSSAAPATVQKFGKAPFVGLTINVDFIKSLFPGGKSN